MTCNESVQRQANFSSATIKKSRDKNKAGCERRAHALNCRALRNLSATNSSYAHDPTALAP